MRSKLIPQILPGKLTWNPKIAKMEVRTMIFLFNHVIFRFHVSFRGCMPLITVFSSVLTGTELLPAKPLQVVKPSSEGFVGKMIHLSQKPPANSWWLSSHLRQESKKVKLNHFLKSVIKKTWTHGTLHHDPPANPTMTCLQAHGFVSQHSHF